MPQLDGTTPLLCRVEDRRRRHLCAARSANGVDNWTIDTAPTLRADPAHYPEELWGVEDLASPSGARARAYAIAHTAFSRGGPGASRWR
ncbi:MAG: hypothetical protein IPG75_15100 [Gemmatimonadetes bacterium]|nr:hypothetical protein [Gemmatimonadota bacterium]